MKQRLKKVFRSVRQSRLLTARYYVSFAIILAGVIATYVVTAQMVVAGPGQPFGGQISAIDECTCSGGILVFFDDLTKPVGITPLPLVYQPGVTIPYPNFMQTAIGHYILGTWLPGAICLTGRFCLPHPIQPAGTMFMVGSS